MATHTLGPTPATVHWGYLDAKIPPRLTVDSGDTVTIDTVSGGLADVGDTSIMLPHHREICEKLKPSPGPHILTGPVAVRGAEPGDTLEVRIKAMQLTVDWGWNLIRPLRGTLPEDYPRVPLPHHSHRPQGDDLQAAVGRDHSSEPILRDSGSGPAAELRALHVGRAARVRRQPGLQGVRSRNLVISSRVRAGRELLRRRRARGAGRRRSLPDRSRNLSHRNLRARGAQEETRYATRR